MPTLHRLSCFRDDIIFLIYMYQRWAYKIDKTRGRYATEETKVPVEAAATITEPVIPVKTEEETAKSEVIEGKEKTE